MNRMIRAAAAAAAIGLWVGGAEAAKTPACVTGADETALQMRTVQTDLMVAALSCAASANYNAFVTGNQKILQGAHAQLQRFFKSHGGEKALNAFITRLANESSKRSVADIATFCVNSGYLYQAILAPNRGDLATFIAPLWVAQLHGFASCTPQASYVIYGPEGPVAVQPAGAAPPAPPAATPPAGAPPAASPPVDTSGIPTPIPKPASIAPTPRPGQ